MSGFEKQALRWPRIKIPLGGFHAMATFMTEPISSSLLKPCNQEQSLIIQKTRCRTRRAPFSVIPDMNFKKVKFFSKTEHFFKKVKIKMKYFKKRKGITNCQERSCWYNGGHMSAKLHQSNLSNSWLSCITWAFNALLFVAIPPKHCSSFPKELSSESSDRYHKTF